MYHTTSDTREQLREQIRLEKRHYRDLRWCAEHSHLEDSDFVDLLKLHQLHGREGMLQLHQQLIPYWRMCQRKQAALRRAVGHPQTVEAGEVLAGVRGVMR